MKSIPVSENHYLLLPRPTTSLSHLKHTPREIPPFGRLSVERPRSNLNPLDLIERHVVAASVIKLRHRGRGMVRYIARDFERAAILEIGRDTCAAHAVVADLPIAELRPSTHHLVGGRLCNGNGGEDRSLRIGTG